MSDVHRGIIMQRSFMQAASALLLATGLSACGPSDTPPVVYAPPSYDYLSKLRLDVAVVDIEDSWAPRPDSHDLGQVSPLHPVEALRQMARDRLLALGTAGHAEFVIDEASLVQFRDRYEGRMTVHLDVAGADGNRSGYAEARVTRSATIENDQPNAARAELNMLVSQMMSDMNVELEFQVRRSLRSLLQKGPQAAPLPAPVQKEELAPPPPAVPGLPTGYLSLPKKP
jgi:hypothetical protein